MSELTSLVATRVEADRKLSEDAKLLVLAALEGDEALDDMGGFTPAAATSTDEPDVEPAGAFLQQIKVNGFRGIGPEAQLDLRPAPGLTIVAGRNGSGKSSFSEALEVALTGTTYRWMNKRSKQWEEAWRNIHEPATPRIQVTLAEERVGRTRLTVEWPAGAQLEGKSTSVQRRGESRQAGTASLGWTGPLETYRPLLTYDELGALFASEPSRLYDALSTVLGLEQVTDAVKRLVTRSKELAALGTELVGAKKALLETLDVDDERAARARDLLSARRLDTPALRALATGRAPDEDGTTARLRAVMQVSLPSRAATAAAAERLTDAVAALASAGDAATEALERRAAVLRAAVDLHAHDGDMPCPVCGQGRLDQGRVDGLHEELERTAQHVASLRRARRELQDARNDARSLVTAPPTALGAPLPDDLEGPLARARDAWSSWSSAPDDDLALAAHLTGPVPAREELEALQSAARSALDARDEAWTAVATRLATYADEADDWARQRPRSDAAKAALRWLKDNEVTLKNERVQPIAKQAAEIWADLRQESNVELAGLTLEGTATRRRVAIAATVDGQDAGALSVMSQGELHALALALFLPRATMPESPFRFVVLDDPVQAMDPAKVDGLVTVLSHIAQRRQVVVFSHDDRLASAVRRAAVDATILEVVREASSKVTVRSTFDPAGRYLRDAFGMVRDDGLPEETLRRLLPGMLRLAVEAAARDRYFSEALSRGAAHAEVEDEWMSVGRTSPRVALALYGEARPLDAWLDKAGHRRRGLGICTRAVHQGLEGDPHLACRDVERMVADIKDGRR
jgi:DNA repair exonuclease SbcCD ATPase subunit